MSPRSSIRRRLALLAALVLTGLSLACGGAGGADAGAGGGATDWDQLTWDQDSWS